MRAWQVQQHGDPIDALKQVDIPDLEPGPGEVRLRVRAAALGMPDAFMCRSTYALTPPLPFTPGQEVCGTIDAVGEGVELRDGVELGSRVMGVTLFTDGRGGFAEQTMLLANNLYPVPDDMSDVDAAAFRIGYSTGWIGLVRRAALQPGEDLLVLGAAGGSGAAAVQLGKALDARVLAVVAGDEKAEFVRGLGADVVIDRLTTDVPSAVLDATDGRGAAVVYDPVGGDAAAGALRCIANEGRLLVVGFASGRWVDVNIRHVVTRNYSIVGVYAGGYTREQNLDDHLAMLDLVDAGRLTSDVVRTAPFDELPAALDEVLRGEVIGKTVLLPAC
jgi:NADPH2:quinone reductase